MADKAFPYPLHCAYATLDGGLPTGRLRRWRHRLKQLRILLDEHEATSVLSMGEYPNVLVASLPNHYRRINRYTNSLSSLVGFKGWLMRQALRVAYARTDATVVPVMRLAAELGLLEGAVKIFEIPNPLDLLEIRNKSNVEIDHPTLVGGGAFFLHVGQLVAQKDHDSLLHAYTRYRAEGGSARLLMIGQGEREGKIRRLIKQLDIADSAVLVGWVDNPLGFMMRAIAMVMASKWEGTPNVMLEAMALGCPIISTDCPTGPSEVLQAGKSGRLVSIGDISSMVDEMHRMERDKDWRAEWSELARQRAEDYSIERIGPRLSALMTGDIDQ
jgi:glycosyltransferase involved in cell wall biosynthesis